MTGTIELIVGNRPWVLNVPDDRAVALRRDAFTSPRGEPRQLVHDALEKPYHFESLRRALTPDDRVTIVIDPRLPHLAEMLSEVLRHIGSAGVPPSAVTVVSPPNSPEDWIDELADEFADVTTETHDPADVKKLAYLATTKGGRRVYLNRSLVEADFVVLLTGRRFSPHTGYAGAEAAIFPALSNEETRAAFAAQFTAKSPKATEDGEAAEIAWLLGSPFFLQAIEGAGDDIQEVVAGLHESAPEGVRRQDARWRGTVSEKADVVVAAVSGDPRRVSFFDLAMAAATAARVVKKGGRIALLTAAAPDLGPGAELLRTLDEPAGAKKALNQEKPDDWAAARLWALAAKHASLFLASGYPDDVVEELFATPVHLQTEVQRLIDTGGKVLLIPDAHKTTVTVDEREAEDDS